MMVVMDEKVGTEMFAHQLHDFSHASLAFLFYLNMFYCDLVVLRVAYSKEYFNLIVMIIKHFHLMFWKLQLEKNHAVLIVIKLRTKWG